MIQSNYFVVLFMLSLLSFGQDDKQKVPQSQPAKTTDTIANPNALQTSEVKEITGHHTKKSEDPNIHSIAPIKASFYSALLPGLGQIYNRKYWKVPLVYAVLGGAFYFFYVNNNDYNRIREAYKRREAGFKDDEFYNLTGSPTIPDTPSISSQTLLSTQESVRQDRDLSFLIMVLAYALNIIDATVDAHLKHFTITNDLSMKIKPFIRQDHNLNSGVNTNAGICLTFNL